MGMSKSHTGSGRPTTAREGDGEMIKKQRIEVRDWYQDAETAPACVIMVEPGADLTDSQIRKVRAACPNWTKDIEEYAQGSDGSVRCRVVSK